MLVTARTGNLDSHTVRKETPNETQGQLTAPARASGNMLNHTKSIRRSKIYIRLG